MTSPHSPADITLTGVLTREDHETYRELAFDVPAGVESITISFFHSHKEERATIDLGVFDGERFRGWSGSDKANFTIGVNDATPSYLPGPIRPGRWTLVLGVPNIRPETRAHYTAEIRFGRGEPTRMSYFSDAALKSGARWYRGDLHMHTCHSDGTHVNQSGRRVPGPVYRTVESAARKGLDFIAITDHNAISHVHALRELQPAFDGLLLIPGVEITTFYGHAGVLGATGFVEFRLGSGHLPTVGDLIDAVEKRHGLFSINHPTLPSNEFCMGCGWTAAGTDFARVPAIEVVNGGAAVAQGNTADGPFSGIPFWERRLNDGFRTTAIGGSDNHKPDADPKEHPAIAAPTTVVHAPELSERAILDAIRAGHVFVDVEGTRDRVLELAAEGGGMRAMMGDVLSLPEAKAAEFTLSAKSLKGARVDVIVDGRHRAMLPGESISSNDATLHFAFTGDGARHWIRADIRSGDDARTLMIGNPIYIR